MLVPGLASAAMLVYCRGLQWIVELVHADCESALEVLVGWLQCSGDYSVANAKVHGAAQKSNLAQKAACLASSAVRRVAGFGATNQVALELPWLQAQGDLVFCSRQLTTDQRCSCLQEAKPAPLRLELASDSTTIHSRLVES